MGKKSNITFLIFARNEEKRIEYPIKCFLPYGEVIVIDNYSTDKTRSIARRLGAKIIPRKKTRQGFAETKETADFLYQYVKTDWVFWGFADEMVPKPCLELYKKISQGSKYKIVVQKKKTFLYGEKREYLPCWFAIKFFRKDSIDFSDNIIHRMGRFAPHVKPSEVLYLPPIDEYSIYHFQNHTMQTLLKHFGLYTTRHTRFISPRFLGLRLIFTSFYSFIWIYIIGGALRYGVQGLIIAIQYSFYHSILYSQVYEKSNNLNLSSIEKKFAKMKKRLLVISPKSSLWQKLTAKSKIAVISRLHKYYKFRQKSP